MTFFLMFGLYGLAFFAWFAGLEARWVGGILLVAIAKTVLIG